MTAPNVTPFLHRANSPIEIPEEAAIIPGPGRILIRVARDTEGKYGKIILPPSPGEGRKFYGRVEAIGRLVDDGIEEDEGEDHWIKVGDLVFFGKFSGTTLNINRDEYIICREVDILGIVKDASTIQQLMETQEDA